MVPEFRWIWRWSHESNEELSRVYMYLEFHLLQPLIVELKSYLLSLQINSRMCEWSVALI